MDNTRNLKDIEVPAAAVESVKKMTVEIVNNLVGDFIKELNLKGKTIADDNIDMLKGVVLNRTVITLKVKAAVDLGLVGDMKIPIVDLDQVSLQGFGAD